MRGPAATLMRSVLLLWLGLSLAACGFHLRGSVELPPVMARSFVEAGQAGELAAEVRGLLQSSGVQVVSSRGDATVVIRLLGEQRQRRVIAVDTSGAASAYELTYQVRFELRDGEDAVLMPPQSLSRSRDLNFDGGNVLGKSREEEQIYAALRTDLATAILQRIQYGLPRVSQ
jgi:LPS-assembly lipoprotein